MFALTLAMGRKFGNITETLQSWGLDTPVLTESFQFDLPSARFLTYQDTVLEPKYFEEACKILNNHGFMFDSYLMKNEGHTVSAESLKLTKNFIKKHMT